MEPAAPLNEPSFRALWLAGLISDAGDWMLLVALPIVVYALTGSALGTSAAFLAELAPGVLLAPLAGRIADRVDRRALLIGVALAQAAALAPLLLVHGRSGLPIVYAVIVAEAALNALFDPAKNALLPALVAPGSLVPANALIGLGAAAGRLAGGPLGGLLLAAGHLHLIVAVDAVSFLLAALLISRTAPAHTEVRPTPEGPRGFRAALHGTVVRRSLAVAFVASISQGVFVVLFIVFVARRLHGGAGEIGLLRGVQAFGAIGAGLVLASIARRPRSGALIAGAAGAFGVVSLVVWNAPAVTAAEGVYVVLFVIVGAPGVAFEAGLLSLLAQSAAARERGRVMSGAGLAEAGGQALGMLAAGGLTAVVGLTAMLDAQGALYVAAGGLAAITLRDGNRHRTRVRLRGETP